MILKKITKKSQELKQSYNQIEKYYHKLLKDSNMDNWDYIILTASNKDQASIYEAEIKERINKNQIPANTTYLVIPDLNGKRVGSGGATLNALKNIYDGLKDKEELKEKRILMIHSGRR